jgi:hypothetical protein
VSRSASSQSGTSIASSNSVESRGMAR